MFPDRGDSISSKPTSRQPSATRSDTGLHDKSSSQRSDFATQIARRSARSHSANIQTSTEYALSSNESDEEEEDNRRLTHVKRANTFSRDYSEDEETIIVKKFDRKLVLFLAFLYLLSFLDRSSMHICYTLMAISDRYRHWQC